MWQYLWFLKHEEASAVERLMGADSALSDIPKPEVYSFLCFSMLDYQKANVSRKLKKYNKIGSCNFKHLVR